MHERRLSDVVGTRGVVSVESTAHVLDAARMMAKHEIGAVLVVADGKTAGIFSERDVLTRVVASQRDPAATRVAEVMTPALITASPATKAVDALRIMQENGFRHLPVCDGVRPIGMVSLRDFLGAEMAEAQDEVAFEHLIEEELW